MSSQRFERYTGPRALCGPEWCRCQTPPPDGVPSFTSVDTFTIKGRGVCYVVELDRCTDDFAHLLGKTVVIDGQSFVAAGVERYAIMRHPRGETISILTKAVPS
jgi:hypothetical protein